MQLKDKIQTRRLEASCRYGKKNRKNQSDKSQMILGIKELTQSYVKELKLSAIFRRDSFLK